MSQPRISYVPLDSMDEAMRAEMERCARIGTPRPESSAVRAHVPAVFWSLINAWDATFRSGVLEHGIKELCRGYVTRSVVCEFCGNQRSLQAASQGIKEAQYDELTNFEKSAKYDERQKAALAYAEAIVWRLDPDDAFWQRMYAHFNEAELVELAFVVGMFLGQQSWLRLLNLDHEQYMAGTSASLAPGFETAEARAKAKASADYWAKKPGR